MGRPLLLAIDQGSSSTKCLLVDDGGRIVGRGQAPVGQSTPEPGWVQQDPAEIWDSVRRAVAAAVPEDRAGDVVSVGLSTQRESCVIWDRHTGEALTPVLSWQDQRTEPLCARLRAAGHGDTVRRISGLPLDPMFSAAKAAWLLDRIDPERAKARAGALVVGTIDSFLMSRFGGEPVVEAGNASRTQLVDVVRADYAPELLELLGIPRAALPDIRPSVGPFPTVRGLAPLPDGVPLHAVMADSHAALFAHGAFAPGPVKATHGTGSSIMGLMDRAATRDGATLDPGLCVTVAWWLDEPVLAFEGNVRSFGSTLLWAADLLGIDAAGLAELAATVEDAGNVHLVPGFNGLGAPWWDAGAVATLSGMDLGGSRAAVARAALDSLAHQIADVLDSVRASGVSVERLHVDGGPTRNAQLMGFEADMTGVTVARSGTEELSALGVAHLAGLTAGVFDRQALADFDRGATLFEPRLGPEAREDKRARWRRAVARSRS
ncbi:glycerol kinase [Pseudoxanthobacter soli DSM 19599]|uniref:Glycerol kinase n=1 Tax=Pseudoxanthobacter soli DSM 19599 TaxID=1123029 RepID=A0A1M7ZR40_9HYPH|nr:FGGY family carbohydrate kinase [Pseudoxanthobacter soli]SHO67373.1 glycerol kinase [Pseudoxanthobacter soli DSM 19599]